MRNYEGYAVYNKKTDKIVAVDVCVGWGSRWMKVTVFRNKEDLKYAYSLKNEEIRKVRVIPESHFE